MEIDPAVVMPSGIESHEASFSGKIELRRDAPLKVVCQGGGLNKYHAACADDPPVTAFVCVTLLRRVYPTLNKGGARTPRSLTPGTLGGAPARQRIVS